MPNNKPYNGWKNYETWNIALWINNDEGFYRWVKALKEAGYKNYKEVSQSLMNSEPKGTPDGVAWNDSQLDIKALDKMIKEL